MKLVYIVTHGKTKEESDPGLTPEGQEQIRRLRGFLPKTIDYLVLGVGKRHKETFAILLGPERKPDHVSRFAGVPETLSADGSIMLLPDGNTMSLAEYTKKHYPALLKGAKALFKELCDQDRKGENILVVGSRLAVIGAGVEKAESGVLYVFQGGKLLDQHSGA